jgi:hypothetical protein
VHTVEVREIQGGPRFKFIFSAHIRVMALKICVAQLLRRACLAFEIRPHFR